MLELQHLTIRLKKDGRILLEDFSFSLLPGDKAAIIGEEGNGKSTLLRYLFDPAAVEEYCECEGKVLCRGKPAYLPQLADRSLDRVTLGEYFADTEYYLYTDTLTRLGLTTEWILSDQPLGTLSGGERVKAQLARLLMTDPDVLLLDEPTNDLDIETLEWLERFINTTRLPVLFISHDETLIENTANVILHMEQLIRKTTPRITVSRMAYRDYLADRLHRFEHQDQVAQKQRDDYDKQMEKWRQIYQRVDHEQNAISRGDPGGARLLKKKMHSVLSMGKRFEREKENFTDFSESEDAILTRFDPSVTLPAGKTVLDAHGLTVSAGGRTLAENVALRVMGGEHIGIIGRNGAGKTTLLSVLWGQLRDRTDIVPYYMPQDYLLRLEPAQSPVVFLAPSGKKEDVTRVRTFLGNMRFTHEEMTDPAARLSGGQRAKVLFLDMVLRGADVLLLDEPTRNFSPLSGPVVREALRDFGGTIISVSHDRKYLREVCDKVYRLTEAGLTEERM